MAVGMAEAAGAERRMRAFELQNVYDVGTRYFVRHHGERGIEQWVLVRACTVVSFMWGPVCDIRRRVKAAILPLLPNRVTVDGKEEWTADMLTLLESTADDVAKEAYLQGWVDAHALASVADTVPEELWPVWPERDG